MKKFFFTLLSSLSLVAVTQAQSPILITEFSYNPPESGTDSLEYVEIFNNSANAVDVSNYRLLFATTPRCTIPTNTSLAPYSTLVIAVNAAAVQRQYNMTTAPLQWSGTAGLSNSSGILVLKNASNVTVDTVSYSTATLPSLTNGNGASVVLCDLSADNNVMSNWSASTNAILNTDSSPRTINAKALFGSPGFMECGLSSAPANDECTGATSLTVGTTCTVTTGSYEDATESLLPCVGTDANDVWFSFVATSNRLKIDVTTVSSDIVFEVFSGSCASLTSIECMDDEISGTESYSNAAYVVGETYYVRVYEYDGQNTNTESFDICVTEIAVSPNAPINDECTGAIALTVGATCVSTVGSYEDASLSLAPCEGTDANDVWYSFVATAVNMEIQVTTSTSDIVFQAFTGTCANLSSLGCIDYVSSGTEYANGAVFVVGQTYYVRVYEYDGQNTNTESFDICILETPLPANDECANAIVLTPNPDCTTTVAGSTRNATETLPEGACETYDGYAADVWYSFVADAVDAVVLVEGVGYFDVIIEAYSGSCSALPTTSLGCGDNTASATDSLVLSNLTIGNTYYVRVYDYEGGYFGDFDFNICIKSQPIITPDPCTPGLLTLTLDGCSGTHEVSNVTGGMNPYSYEWSTGDTTASVTGLLVGSTYSVTVTDTQGCSATSTFLQEVCVGIGEVASGFNMNVYPNPAKEVAILSLQTTNSVDLQVELVNVMGQVISSQAIVNQGKMTYNLPIENLTSGVYFVKVSSKEGVATQRLMIAK